VTEIGSDLSPTKFLCAVTNVWLIMKTLEEQRQTQSRPPAESLVFRLKMSLKSGSLRFSDLVTKRNGGSGDENEANAA